MIKTQRNTSTSNPPVPMTSTPRKVLLALAEATAQPITTGAEAEEARINQEVPEVAGLGPRITNIEQKWTTTNLN